MSEWLGAASNSSSFAKTTSTNDSGDTRSSSSVSNATSSDSSAARRAAAPHRRKAGYRQVGLVVVIDADGETVAQRERRLANELRRSKQQDRQAGERIVHWIPRRHIETWVAFLRGRTVDEQMDCKGLVGASDYHPATKTFVEIYREPNRRPTELLPSLTHGLDETNRLVGQTS
jgi:hypothetical protein